MDKYLREYPDALDYLEKINEMSEIDDLSTIISEGPSELLTRTDNVQPAITMISLATLNILIAAGIKPEGSAGHSLGEYAALVTAGILRPDIAVKLTRIRGDLMQRCADRYPGGMLAVLGSSVRNVKKSIKAASELGPIGIANINAKGQVVISGAEAPLKKAGEICKELGAGRVIPLKVSGAWHSPLMKEAAEELSSSLDDAVFYDPDITVVANVTADFVKSASEARELLKQQVVSPVLWRDTIKKLRDSGFDTFVEVGPGRVLQGLMRKMQGITVYGTESKAALEKTLEALS